jgi:hypothetical protein
MMLAHSPVEMHAGGCAAHAPAARRAWPLVAALEGELLPGQHVLSCFAITSTDGILTQTSESRADSLHTYR